MVKKTFLVEIGTEELPPKEVRILGESFAKYFMLELNKSKVTYGNIKWFATPRRLALIVVELSDTQENFRIQKKGPSVSIAIDNKGNFTQAAYCWAKKNDISLEQVEYLRTDKGTWLMQSLLKKGQKTTLLLPSIIEETLKKLPISKMMRWGLGNIQFIRPVRTITLLFGQELISSCILGVQSKRIIRGHRFMSKNEFIIDTADDYSSVLLEYGKVIVDYEIRKLKIKSGIETAARNLCGYVDINNDTLLEEVTSLVEWPVILTANFEEEFLALPAEVLVHTMKINQRYFPVYTDTGKLLPHFIFVTNIESQDSEKIILGNEQVIRSRFSDADFFFKNDLKKRLENYLPRLKTVSFQKKLGTLYDKTKRIQLLATWIALKIGANINHVNRAALLCKCDLVTNMVFEFPAMQGIMGMYYARQQGEVEEVAVALKEYYYPRFAADNLPSDLVSCSIAIADKIDTLVGIFSIDQHPTGDKDPYGLRRLALGIIRIFLDKNFSLDINSLINESVHLYTNYISNNSIKIELFNFILARLRALYQEKGYSLDIIQSVIACRPNNILDVDARIKAITNLRDKGEIASLVMLNKRICNILMKTTDTLNETVDSFLLKEKEEVQLFNYVNNLEYELQLYIVKRRYYDCLIELIKLCDITDVFFKNVMININDSLIRINRLTLLSKIQELILQVGDISLVYLENK